MRKRENFLKDDLILLANRLDRNAKGKWGVMNARQMVEHFADAVKMASGKLILPMVNIGEQLEKSREFLRSEKQFKENYKKTRSFPKRHCLCAKLVWAPHLKN